MNSVSNGGNNNGASTSGGGSASPRSVPSRRRLVRRGGNRSSASVIMSRSHMIPAQYVPEELVNQAQVVLQGKSRNVIIRELQRTNLDVNSAVNNLLSRDDEDFDDADLESELAGIVGGKSSSKIDKPQAKKSVATKGKPGKRQPPKNPGEEEDGN